MRKLVKVEVLEVHKTEYPRKPFSDYATVRFFYDDEGVADVDVWVQVYNNKGPFKCGAKRTP